MSALTEHGGSSPLRCGTRRSPPAARQFLELLEEVHARGDLPDQESGGQQVSHSPSSQQASVVGRQHLHGGHGRGDDYLLTWLRTAKSAGYIVLSPKSLGGTWSLQQPGVDIRSILSMIETLLDEYNIDIGRIFATGLSDGGSFSYAIGLSNDDKITLL